jgi:hypothetical protein
MLHYFLEHKHISQVEKICDALNKTKQKLVANSFDNAKEHYIGCDELFLQIKELAISIHDEKLANSQLIFQNYFRLFCDILWYFDMLKRGQYKDSWVKLQDCLDNIKYIGRFTAIENRLDLAGLYDLLVQYESLYPYSIFCSSEYVISKSHCSICGKSMQSLECPHIKGNLYWGEPAIECIDKIDVVQALCIVSHPEDKRCILEVADDDRTEQEKFIMLHQYVELHQPALQQFSIEGFTERRVREDMKIVGRKQPCPCGSGKRFKHCCGKDMYYEHIRYVVTPGKQVLLNFF